MAGAIQQYAWMRKSVVARLSGHLYVAGHALPEGLLVLPLH